ncbi:hypothetical protein P3W45_001036 [Vairimorpha bombi]
MSDQFTQNIFKNVTSEETKANNKSLDLLVDVCSSIEKIEKEDGVEYDTSEETKANNKSLDLLVDVCSSIEKIEKGDGVEYDLMMIDEAAAYGLLRLSSYSSEEQYVFGDLSVPKDFINSILCCKDCYSAPDPDTIESFLECVYSGEYSEYPEVKRRKMVQKAYLAEFLSFNKKRDSVKRRRLETDDLVVKKTKETTNEAGSKKGTKKCPKRKINVGEKKDKRRCTKEGKTEIDNLIIKEDNEKNMRRIPKRKAAVPDSKLVVNIEEHHEKVVRKIKKRAKRNARRKKIKDD